MALTDFWQLKDNADILGKNLLNVYHVKRILAGADAQDVAEAFAFSILTLNLLGMQDFNMLRSTVEVENLGDPTDFFSYDSTALKGTDAASHLPTFNAATIQFNRTRIDMKNGQKRLFVGNEGDLNENVWTTAFQDQITLVADTIIDTWKTAAAPAVDVCAFVILKRFCVVPDQVPCVKYRLPETDTEIDGNHYVPLTHLVRPRVRSQVSRKIL